MMETPTTLVSIPYDKREEKVFWNYSTNLTDEYVFVYEEKDRLFVCPTVKQLASQATSIVYQDVSKEKPTILVPGSTVGRLIVLFARNVCLLFFLFIFYFIYFLYFLFFFIFLIFLYFK